jgi:uncharacterized membrane protein YgcG
VVTRDPSSLILALALAAGSARAQSLPPPSGDWVRDDLGALSPDHRDLLARTIFALERDTGAEVGVYLGRTAGGMEPARFAVELFNHWGIGKQGRNNGVLLLILIDDGAVELTPGQGYRDVLDAARAGRILDEVVPSLRARTGEAVLTGVRRIADVIRAHERAPAEPSDLRTMAVELERPFGGGLQRVAPPPRPARPRPPPRPVSTDWTWLGDVGLFLGGLCGLPSLVIGMLVGAALLSREKCPRCRRYMESTCRTLVEATYTSTGRGEWTHRCANCEYHGVEVYTIAQRVPYDPNRSSSSSGSSSSSSRSSSSSSSSSGSRSSSGGGRSFGGGRSSGGGAGRRF